MKVKNIYSLVMAICLLFVSCEKETVDTTEEFVVASGKWHKKKKRKKLVRKCRVLNADRCNLPNYAASSFWWPNEGEGGYLGLFSVSDVYKMTYREFRDGTINIKGQTELNGCVVDINLWLKDKKNYDDWTAGGGLFKAERESNSCSEVEAESLSYYVVDDAKSSMVASGCGDRDGQYVITHRPEDERYAFQVGRGGALFDTGDDYGVSGWAYAVDVETGESHILDFNFIVDCRRRKRICRNWPRYRRHGGW